MNNASAYFNENWKSYQETIRCNVLFHREMMALLKQFLDSHFQNQGFSLVDVGCGDCTSLAGVLSNYKMSEFVGIDAAADVLPLARENCGVLNCELQFLADDMKRAVATLPKTYDVIYSSYAIHHLTQQEKIDFLKSCYEKLKSGGYLLMIDGVRTSTQSRDDWVQALEDRMRTAMPHLSEEQIETRMQHPRADDLPENLETFKNMAKSGGWEEFQVLLQNEIVGFFVFGKK